QKVLADKAIYDRNTGQITAIGHVVLITETNDTYYSDKAVLEKGMHHAIVEHLEGILKQRSWVVADEGERLDEHTFVLKNSVFSPCPIPLCYIREQLGLAREARPLWRVRSSQTTLDNTSERIIHKHAFLDFMN
ncbi:MAG: hypothetical protein CUN55_19670, partial [Phototrophicales bacterium]